MVKFPPQVGVRGVDVLFLDEPDPFIPGVRVVPCPKAVPEARQRGPVIQVNAQGVPMSIGTVWAGAAYADGAMPTTAERPLRPAPEPPLGRCNCAKPRPDGPAVALSPRLDADTGAVEGKPCTAPPAKRYSSGDPLKSIQHPPVFARSPHTRARSAGPPLQRVG